jgi:ResB-like family protein
MSTTLDAPADAPAPQRSPRPHAVNPMWRVLRVLASLQLTVALFAMSMLLVFFGTLAQVDKGIWTVVDEYFRSWSVWVPFQLIATFGWKFFEFPGPSTQWGGSFPLPGGWLLGAVMLVNLLAAHLTRFKLSWRRSGIILIHVGVIMLMVGELVTGLYAVESNMILLVGEKSNFVDHSRRVEIVFTDPATNRTVTIPHGMLKPGTTLAHPDLPVDVEVVEYIRNTNLQPALDGDDLDGVVNVFGVRYKVVPASEQAGVRSDREDAVAIRVKLLKKDTSEVLAERLMSLWQYPNYSAGARQYTAIPVEVQGADGKPVRVQLRNERIYKPYTVELLKFEHKRHAGMSTPKDFASTVRLLDPETGDDREVRIWMNHPLSHRGQTFYQHQVVLMDDGTGLQVVNNPGWMLPYASCIIVAVGMLIHFGMNLSKFTERRAAA